MTAVAVASLNKEKIVKLLLDRPDVDVNAHASSHSEDFSLCI